jgi:hypothetical protein
MMKFRNLIAIGLLALVTMMAPAAAIAADFDGSRPLLVAIIDVIECHPGGDCEKVSPQEARLPRFLEIEFDKQEISEIGDAKEERRTEIQSMTQHEGLLILQGAQNGRGWTVNITEANGDAVITVSDPLSGFVVFGACTPR